MRTFKERLRDGERLVGMWLAAGSPVNAEICAGSGLDLLVIDGEHAPNDLRSILAQLQAIAPHPIAPIVRLPIGDTVLIKQHLDIGATTILVPVVESGEQAAELVRAMRYPPAGVRGVGSGFARAAQWGRTPGYLQSADDAVTLLVQVETVRGLAAIEDIAAVDGVDGVFVGPADLAASLGHLGDSEHADVVAAVEDAIRRIVAAGKPAGVNAFAEAAARRYMDAGASFVLAGADVTMLAVESARLAVKFRD